MNPSYVRPIEFAEASYAPTLPGTLRPTYKGCTSCGLLRNSMQPSGILGAARRISGLSGSAFDTLADGEEASTSGFWLTFAVVSGIGAGLGGYHGYKRSGGSMGSAIGWGLLGGLFPVITTVVALAQGFGECSR